MQTMARLVRAATALAVGLSVAALGVVTPSASAATGSMTIDATGTPSAGTVELTGRVGVAPGEMTTVLYVIDGTNSTAAPTGADCSGNGASGVEDDLNGDGSVGDILDCEIAGVLSLNRSLASTQALQVGLVAFANQGAAADLDPVGTATFVPPAYTGGDARPRIDTVTASVVRDQIRLYDPKTLGGSGSGDAFNSAIRVALSTLGTAPAGPKWIMFLSDGQAAIDDGLLTQLSQSGVRLRSFGIGADATCASFSSLYKMASATGERCVLTPNPASLAAGITGAEPDAVNGVTVSIGDVSVAAALDAVSGWRASFTLGAGTHTATATAMLASGAIVRAQRTFDVASAPGGPPPGTVAPLPGSLKATAVKVSRPKPSRDVLPPRVTGRVESLGSRLATTPELMSSQVLLQAREEAGDPWTTVARDRVNSAGEFALKWAPKVRLRLLRVSLLPHQGFAGSADAVPQAQISACKVGRSRAGGWSVTCQTTAKANSAVALLQRGKVVDQSRVRKGTFRLRGKGSVSGSDINITVSKRRHIRLGL